MTDESIRASDAAARPTPLVGRVAELSALQQMVDATCRGGRLAVVEGEAGIGKSRLIEAARTAARRAGLPILSARAEELESHCPFAAVADCIGRQRIGAELGAWEVRPDLAGSRQFRVAELMLEQLEGLCARGPALVVVEDLHWADVGTIGVLARVASEIEALPVTLLVSMRPRPRRPELERMLAVFAAHGSRTVLLGPLDERSSMELATALVGARPGGALARQVARAGGHPLFLCEMVGALLADGAVGWDAGVADLTSPAAEVSLPVTIVHRLSLVPADVLDLLSLASVIGSRFAAADLALLAGRPISALTPALRAARRAGVLAGQRGQLAFRHELIRDALYHDMPLTVRQGLHREFAAALADAGEPTERVAGHLLRAAVPGDQRDIRAIRTAARGLVDRAPGLAADLYRRAIDLAAVPQSAREEVLPELAQALVAAGRFSAGERACREALRRQATAEGSSSVRLQLMFLLLRQARTAETIAEGERGLACPDLDARDRCRIRSLIAMAQAFSGPTAQAIEQGRAILDESDDEFARALATSALTAAAAGRGAYTEADELIAPVVRWAERTGSRAAHDARPHLLRGLTLIHLDRFDEAQATIHRGRDAAECLGIVDAVPVFHFQQALLDFSRGRLDDALAELDTRTHLAEQVRIGWHVPAEGLYALIAVHRDDLLSAERHAAAAEHEFATGTSPHGTELMVLARARLDEASSGPAAALDAIAGFTNPIPAGSVTLLPSLGPELARLAARTGQTRRACGVVPGLRRLADLNPAARSLQAFALQAQGLLEADRDALLAALDLLRDCGLALEAARAAEDAAALGDPTGALLGEAAATYARCGAQRDASRVEAALRRRGVRRGARGPRRRPATGWDALTATELRVVRLVTERLTNREIAQRMFLSRRTVQTHVSHALAKLGVATRRELAAEAARRAGWHLRVDGTGEWVPAQRRPTMDSQRRVAEATDIGGRPMGSRGDLDPHAPA